MAGTVSKVNAKANPRLLKRNLPLATRPSRCFQRGSFSPGAAFPAAPTLSFIIYPDPPPFGRMNKAGSLPSSRVVLAHELKRYYEPLRLPSRAAALSFPYTPRSVASPPPSTGLQHWAISLREHAAPATPGVDRRHFRSSNAHPTAFPFWPQGRLLQFVYEATHRFTCVTACSLAVWKLTTPCYHDAAFSCYRGVRTTPQTGLQPARLTAVTANGQGRIVCSQNKPRPGPNGTYLTFLGRPCFSISARA